MRDFPSDRGPRGLPPCLVAVVVCLGTALPGAVRAQETDIVSKSITVGPTEVSLSLELDGGTLDVSLVDGVVEIDGNEVGRLGSDDPLEQAWRQLIGSAVAMDGDALANILVEWTPPSGLPGPDAELGRRIDAALESALMPQTLRNSGRDAAVSADRLVEALLSRSDRLRELGDALDGVDLDDVQVRIGEDVFVSREATVDGTLLAVDADVQIEGTVRGDLIVVDGTLALSEGARVIGDVRLADSRLLSDEGIIEGRLTEVSASGEPDVRAREAGADDRASEDSGPGVVARNRGPDLLRPFRAIGRGLAGLVATVVNVTCLALLGWLVVYTAGDNLAVVAETARRSTGRSALVGLAGAFLILPVWLFGALALVITIVGIFALPFWLVLFPIAVAAAAGLGFYGVASGIGEGLSRWRHPLVRWLRSANGYALVAGGLIVLALPFALSNVAEMAVFLGALEVLLFVAGCLALGTAGLVGFGAVLLTRGGRRSEFDWAGPTDGDPDGRHWFGPRSSEAGQQAPDPPGG